jgi:hypothetical protein
LYIFKLENKSKNKVKIGHGIRQGKAKAGVIVGVLGECGQEGSV